MRMQWAGIGCGAGLGTGAAGGAGVNGSDEAGVLCQVGAAVSPARWVKRPSWERVTTVISGEGGPVAAGGDRRIPGEVVCEAPPL